MLSRRHIDSKHQWLGEERWRRAAAFVPFLSDFPGVSGWPQCNARRWARRTLLGPIQQHCEAGGNACFTWCLQFSAMLALRQAAFSTTFLLGPSRTFMALFPLSFFPHSLCSCQLLQHHTQPPQGLLLSLSATPHLLGCLLHLKHLPSLCLQCRFACMLQIRASVA